ncbi:nucleosidase [Tessaracoccus massiliensis]|uniref:nucleosidase n=1 Tax=Tessaracoccus massiliensis TaxID=1522311 RepID=UPI0005903BB1|nr:nucleosidase [Tessaracoccus massiliensis]
MTTPELLRPVDPEAPLLVVATRQEAEHLSADLPILLTGIGRINTVAALTEVLVGGVKPTSMISIGTAGSLGSASGVHRVGSVLLHDFSHSAVADLTGGVAYPPITLADDGPVLATGDLFVEDSATRARLAEMADLVDMEGYAVAWVARRHGVPVELIKLVSDPADEDAGQLWVDGVAECSRILDAHMSERFSAGGAR